MIVAFFDSNVLLYAYDERDPVKHRQATDVIEQHVSDRSAFISTQVVQEFYSIATRKLGLSGTTARAAVSALQSLSILPIEMPHILRAIELDRKAQTSFWDGLIVAAAEACQADVLYSDDLGHGRKYGSLRVLNPFRA